MYNFSFKIQELMTNDLKIAHLQRNIRADKDDNIGGICWAISRRRVSEKVSI